MKLAWIACAGLFLLAGGAAAQDGGKAITKTTISLGTATPGGGFAGRWKNMENRDYTRAFRETKR